MDNIIMDAVHLSRCTFQIQSLDGSSKGYLLFVKPDMRLAESFMDKVKKFKNLDEAKAYEHQDYHVLIGAVGGYNNLFVVIIPEDSRYTEIIQLFDHLIEIGGPNA